MSCEPRTSRHRPRLIGFAAIALLVSSLVGCAAEPGGDAVLEPVDPLAEVRSIAALGDSFSTAMNACDEFGDCPEASWSVGSDPAVQSLATRIGEVAGERPEVFSAAVSGGRLADAIDALPAVVAADPQLVTVLIGGNDACASSIEAMPSAADFGASFGEIIDTLSSELPDALVLAMSLPSFETYWQLADDEPRAAELWSQFGFCPSALSGLGDSADAAANRESVRARVGEYNAAIAATCAAASNCVDDGGALTAHRFSADEVSPIDFVHPSIRGQAVIADLAWRALSSTS